MLEGQKRWRMPVIPRDPGHTEAERPISLICLTAGSSEREGMPALGLVTESSRECWVLPIHYIRLLLQAEGNIGRRKTQVPCTRWNKLLHSSTVARSILDDPGQSLYISEPPASGTWVKHVSLCPRSCETERRGTVHMC